MIMPPLSQSDAIAIAGSRSALATAPFTPSETTAAELADRISATWLFSTSLAGRFSLDIVVKFTRPGSHFDVKEDRVLSRYRDAVFPGLDEDLVIDGVTTGITTACLEEVAPRLASADQIQAVSVRSQWTLTGRRAEPLVFAHLGLIEPTPSHPFFRGRAGVIANRAPVLLPA